MGLFDHLKFIGNMKAENALNKAEDPSEVFDYNYAKQLEQLQELKRGLVTVVQNEKHVELLESQVEAQQNRLQQQALQAMQQNRENLARLALQKKEALTSQVDAYKTQLTQLGEEHRKIELLVQKMEQKIQEFGTQKEMVKAQYQAAKASVEISEVASGISKENAQMGQAMQRAQEKVLNMQSRANAIDALLDSGTLDQNVLGSGQTDLDRQLAQLTSAHNVDDQLEALKKQLG